MEYLSNRDHGWQLFGGKISLDRDKDGVLAGGNKKTKVYALSYKDIKFIVESSNKTDQQKLDNAVYKEKVVGI